MRRRYDTSMRGASGKGWPNRIDLEPCTRAGHAAANLEMLRRVAVSLLKRTDTKGSIKTRRMRAGWDNEYLLQVL